MERATFGLRTEGGEQVKKRTKGSVPVVGDYQHRVPEMRGDLMCTWTRGNEGTIIGDEVREVAGTHHGEPLESF